MLALKLKGLDYGCGIIIKTYQHDVFQGLVNSCTNDYIVLHGARLLSKPYRHIGNMKRIYFGSILKYTLVPPFKGCVPGMPFLGTPYSLYHINRIPYYPKGAQIRKNNRGVPANAAYMRPEAYGAPHAPYGERVPHVPYVQRVPYVPQAAYAASVSPVNFVPHGPQAPYVSPESSVPRASQSQHVSPVPTGSPESRLPRSPQALQPLHRVPHAPQTPYSSVPRAPQAAHVSPVPPISPESHVPGIPQASQSTHVATVSAVPRVPHAPQASALSTVSRVPQPPYVAAASASASRVPHAPEAAYASYAQRASHAAYAAYPPHAPHAAHVSYAPNSGYGAHAPPASQLSSAEHMLQLQRPQQLPLGASISRPPPNFSRAGSRWNGRYVLPQLQKLKSMDSSLIPDTTHDQRSYDLTATEFLGIDNESNERKLTQVKSLIDVSGAVFINGFSAFCRSDRLIYKQLMESEEDSSDSEDDRMLMNIRAMREKNMLKFQGDRVSHKIAASSGKKMLKPLNNVPSITLTASSDENMLKLNTDSSSINFTASSDENMIKLNNNITSLKFTAPSDENMLKLEEECSLMNLTSSSDENVPKADYDSSPRNLTSSSDENTHKVKADSSPINMTSNDKNILKSQSDTISLNIATQSEESIFEYQTEQISKSALNERNTASDTRKTQTDEENINKDLDGEYADRAEHDYENSNYSSNGNDTDSNYETMQYPADEFVGKDYVGKYYGYVPAVSQQIRYDIQATFSGCGITINQQNLMFARRISDLIFIMLRTCFEPREDILSANGVILCICHQNACDIGLNIGLFLSNNGLNTYLHINQKCIGGDNFQHYDLLKCCKHYQLFITSNKIVDDVYELPVPDYVVLVMQPFVRSQWSPELQNWLANLKVPILIVDPPVNYNLISTNCHKYAVLPILPLEGFNESWYLQTILCNLAIPGKIIKQVIKNYKSPFGIKKFVTLIKNEDPGVKAKYQVGV